MRLFLTGIAVLLTCTASHSHADQTRRAPQFTLPDLQDKTVSLSMVTDEHTAILFFWASWCPYCKALMPHLQSIQLEYNDEIEILALNIFDEDNDPAKFMNDAGYDFTTLPHADAVAAAYGIKGTPGVLVVGAERAVYFDLRQLQRRKPPAGAKSNRAKAAYRAPYWAAQIRLAVDQATGARD